MKADLGPCASLHGRRLLPAWSEWNRDISTDPVDPLSSTLVASIGGILHPDFGSGLWNGLPIGIPYNVVDGRQAMVPTTFTWKDESDPGPYPIPSDATVESGPDKHLIVLNRDSGLLYEIYNALKGPVGWSGDAGAVFNTAIIHDRPAGWTSADAAGLPILPGLVRYDEVIGAGEIRHALRFTAPKTRRAYTYPARHFASNDASVSLPPMGCRLRLKAGYDLSSFPRPAQVILTALKRYGMFLADNGGALYLSGHPDPRWPDVSSLSRVKASDFEVVKMGVIVT